MPSVVFSLMLAGAVLAPLVEGNQIGPGWRVVTLPRQTKPVTRFVPEVVAERPSLRVDADHAYGNLVFDLPAPQPPPRLLQWSWRVDQPNPAADLHTRAGDDTPVKVCLSFDLSIDNLGFGERQMLRFMRGSSDEAVPGATLCWVWGAAEPRGALIENAFTRRVRYIVLRNGSDASATWFDESRDIAADFKRAFGEESASIPPLLGVVVGGDSDNTATRSVAHLRALRFEP